MTSHKALLASLWDGQTLKFAVLRYVHITYTGYNRRKDKNVENHGECKKVIQT